MKITNATYYDTEGLELLFRRCIAAAKSVQSAPFDLRSGMTADRFQSPVFIRLTSSDSVSIAWSAPDADGISMLNLSIPRKGKLFESELEAFTYLSKSEPEIPADKVCEIGLEFLLKIVSYSARRAIRLNAPNGVLSDWLNARILPGCRIAIHDKRAEGSSREEKIVLAQQGLLKAKRTLVYLAGERALLQEKAKNLVENTKKAEAKLAKHEKTLKELGEGGSDGGKA